MHSQTLTFICLFSSFAALQGCNAEFIFQNAGNEVFKRKSVENITQDLKQATKDVIQLLNSVFGDDNVVVKAKLEARMKNAIAMMKKLNKITKVVRQEVADIKDKAKSYINEVFEYFNCPQVFCRKASYVWERSKPYLREAFKYVEDAMASCKHREESAEAKIEKEAEEKGDEFSEAKIQKEREKQSEETSATKIYNKTKEQPEESLESKMDNKTKEQREESS